MLIIRKLFKYDGSIMVGRGMRKCKKNGECEKNHLVLDPEEKQLCEEDRVGDHIEDEETQERFREEPEKENVLIEIDANAKYIFLPKRRDDEGF